MNAADERNGRDADEAIRDLTLMLMYLTSWEERPYGVRRCWKGYDFDVLNALAEQELISDSKRARSVCFTEEGEHRARDLLAKYKIVAP
jgi:hypothetical protein